MKVVVAFNAYNGFITPKIDVPFPDENKPLKIDNTTMLETCVINT